ncbi:type VI secretion system tip protein TssI/VgrG [Massilia sp. W12]|uniref:type VI secretion system Vgr family protein n=1 Tax=Massilia sp. W12 TaxID=3126507 RepID=UPI0030D3EEAE
MRDLSLVQSQRELQFHSPLGPDLLLPIAMFGEESLGQPYCYRLQLVSSKRDLQPQALLGKTVSLQIQHHRKVEREFNGVATRLRRVGAWDNVQRYELELRPWFWLLSKSRDCRIFQKKSVIEIIKDVCGKPVYGGLGNLDMSALKRNYPKLEYCVQYRESDMHFLLRLMQRFGIYFYFKHADKQHKMCLIDSPASHTPSPGWECIAYAADDSRNRYGDTRITAWDDAGEIQSAAYEHTDYDFTTSFNSLHGVLRKKDVQASHQQAQYEVYDFPGGYALEDGELGCHLAGVAMHSLAGQARLWQGQSNAHGLAVGHAFTLSGHPQDAQNAQYLIVAQQVELHAEDLSSGNGESEERFRCDVQAIRSDAVWLPPQSLKKPLIAGPQTAIVVGPKGREIWTDKYGRVKLQFHWDRLGKFNEESSCWVRVSQNWAGRRWGAMFLPRIGMEVIVEFLEGDPDRPIITGCVYNSETMPPYALPQHHTRSGIKTQSAEHAQGFNELRFEDKGGAEQIFIHAQRDMDSVVLHNDSQSVGANRSISVKGQHQETVHKDMSVTVKEGHASLTVEKGNHSIKVDAGAQENTVKGDIKVTSVAGEIHLTSPQKIVLTVGGSSITIEPGNITLKSAMIDLNP